MPLELHFGKKKKKTYIDQKENQNHLVGNGKKKVHFIPNYNLT